MFSSTGAHPLCARGSARGAASIRPSALASSSHQSGPKFSKAVSLIASFKPSPGGQTTGVSTQNRKSVSCSAAEGANARSLASPAASQPPHSGYHFDGSSRRFFEGWYWKVQLPGTKDSFAIIFSVEDPGDPNSPEGGLGVQVMGPEDSYICQFQKGTGPFWADRNSLGLGASFKMSDGAGLRNRRTTGMLPELEFQRLVDQGFQASFTQHQGSVISQEAGTPGDALSTVGSASWSFDIKPLQGWGSGRESKATAGWLSVLSLFEPHWQVLMAHGVASGHLIWGDQRYDFTDAPCYAEKNWGGGFPSKWAWIQCNSFDDQPDLSVTAVGARRALLLGVPGVEEDVGLIGIHYNGEFIELVPWTGDVSWDVAPWGKWTMRASSREYDAVLEASCPSDAGTVLRAPTMAQGLAPFCKDTFSGTCSLKVWRKVSGARELTPFIDALSTTAALEVGGGPWWGPWSARAEMMEPFKTMIQAPIDIAALASLVPKDFQPPGL